jgi:hypothetical protein
MFFWCANKYILPTHGLGKSAFRVATATIKLLSFIFALLGGSYYQVMVAFGAGY